MVLNITKEISTESWQLGDDVRTGGSAAASKIIEGSLDAAGDISKQSSKAGSQLITYGNGVLSLSLTWEVWTP